MRFSKVPFALKIESEACNKAQELENFDTRLGTLEEKLTTLLENIKVQSNAQQESSSTKHSDNSFAHLATSIVAEQKEKDKRQLNLIVHKMEELVAEEPSDRKQDDISKVTTLFSNAIRIGQKGTKPRLLKVSISSLQDKISILRGKKNLKNEKKPEHVRVVFITPDYTPLEQTKNKSLREKLNDMNKNGNNYMIKNGTIVPRRS